jgi:hypothetical protein
MRPRVRGPVSDGLSCLGRIAKNALASLVVELSTPARTI